MRGQRRGKDSKGPLGQKSPHSEMLNNPQTGKKEPENCLWTQTIPSHCAPHTAVDRQTLVLLQPVSVASGNIPPMELCQQNWKSGITEVATLLVVAETFSTWSSQLSMSGSRVQGYGLNSVFSDMTAQRFRIQVYIFSFYYTALTFGKNN